MTDDLDTILSEALTGGSVLKTADLVNLTVTIVGIDPQPHDNVFPAEYDSTGKETKAARTSRSYKVAIVMDGETEPVHAWLGGGWLTPQVEAVLARGILPARVKVIRDTTKDGNPYILVSGGQQPTTPSQHVASAVAAAHAAQPTNGKTPAEHCVELFQLKALSTDELTLATLVTTHGGGDALFTDQATTQIGLDVAKVATLPVPVLLNLIKALS